MSAYNLLAEDLCDNSHENLFTEIELFEMFNVDITPDAPHKDGDRSEYEEFPYAFNDIKTHMWSMHERQLSRGEREALLEGDCLRGGITSEPPGSEGRVAALKEYYQRQLTMEEATPEYGPYDPLSPFNDTPN